jgi:hypothetical protein
VPRTIIDAARWRQNHGSTAAFTPRAQYPKRLWNVEPSPIDALTIFAAHGCSGANITATLPVASSTTHSVTRVSAPAAPTMCSSCLRSIVRF